MKRTRKIVTPGQFVSCWQKSTTAKDVIKKTGLSHGAVRARALNYRRKGVELKELFSWPGSAMQENNGHRNLYDWDALKVYARKMLEAPAKPRKVA